MLAIEGIADCASLAPKSAQPMALTCTPQVLIGTSVGPTEISSIRGCLCNSAPGVLFCPAACDLPWPKLLPSLQLMQMIGFLKIVIKKIKILN